MFTQTQLIELRTTNYQLKEDQQKLVTGDNLTHTPIIVLVSTVWSSVSLITGPGYLRVNLCECIYMYMYMFLNER